MAASLLLFVRLICLSLSLMLLLQSSLLKIDMMFQEEMKALRIGDRGSSLVPSPSNMVVFQTRRQGGWTVCPRWDPFSCPSVI